jgi:hypothetical protein
MSAGRRNGSSSIKQLVNVHFKGVFFLTRKVLPLIAGGGRIANLSTGPTRVSAEGWSTYASASPTISRNDDREPAGRGESLDQRAAHRSIRGPGDLASPASYFSWRPSHLRM